MQQITHDVLILGTGLAGLRAAVELSIRSRGQADIGIVSKVQVMRAHSVCAEGGTAAVMRPEEGDSLELHAWDTVKGSDFLADQDTVERFVQTSPDEIRLLEHWGVPWSRREDGRIMQRPFGGILFRVPAWRPTRPGTSRCRPSSTTFCSNTTTSNATTSDSSRPCCWKADDSPAWRCWTRPPASLPSCAAGLF